MSNIVWLNVGGEKFCTSVETLTWHPDTFFTGLLRPDGVGIGYDAEKCIFIDRDPELFKVRHLAFSFSSSFFRAELLITL